MLLIAYKMKFVSKQMPFIIIIIYSACLLMDIISPNWLYTCKRCMPFSVVLKSCLPSRSIKPFSNSIDRYSFNWPKDRKALYINFVLVAPPPFAASRINPIMSVLLLYFILIYSLTTKNQTYGIYEKLKNLSYYFDHTVLCMMN